MRRPILPLAGAAASLTAQPSAEFFEKRIRTALAEKPKGFVVHGGRNGAA